MESALKDINLKMNYNKKRKLGIVFHLNYIKSVSLHL